MTPRDHTRSGRIPDRLITRRPSMVRVNTAAHITVDDTVKNTITRLGALARGLDLLDESDARIYSRRVSGTLAALTGAVVGRILDELGGDSGRHTSLSARIDAVQVIVTSAKYWGRG